MSLPLISNIIESNNIQTKWTVDKLVSILNKNGIKSVLMIGAAFKEDTDDIRNSPTLDIYTALIKKEVNTVIYDEMVELEEYNTLGSLEEVSEKTLIVLMYPLKKALVEKREIIADQSDSIIYTPW